MVVELFTQTFAHPPTPKSVDSRGALGVLGFGGELCGRPPPFSYDRTLRVTSRGKRAVSKKRSAHTHQHASNESVIVATDFTCQLANGLKRRYLDVWKISFIREVSRSSQYLRVAMLWIGEVEIAKSVDDLITSASITGKPNIGVRES